MSIKDKHILAWEAVPATITSGTALSDTINLAGLRLFAIQMPDAWTTADITFQVSIDGGSNWVDMFDQNGIEITGNASSNRYITLDPIQFASIQYVRVRSGTKSVAVNQTADRTLQLVLRDV